MIGVAVEQDLVRQSSQTAHVLHPQALQERRQTQEGETKHKIRKNKLQTGRLETISKGTSYLIKFPAQVKVAPDPKHI